MSIWKTKMTSLGLTEANFTENTRKMIKKYNKINDDLEKAAAFNKAGKFSSEKDKSDFLALEAYYKTELAAQDKVLVTEIERLDKDKDLIEQRRQQLSSGRKATAPKPGATETKTETTAKVVAIATAAKPEETNELVETVETVETVATAAEEAAAAAAGGTSTVAADGTGKMTPPPLPPVKKTAPKKTTKEDSNILAFFASVAAGIGAFFLGRNLK